MKKLKIIFNLITLALTTGLLVMITLAWYAVNKTASVNEAIGCTASGKNLYLSTTYSGADSFLYSETTFENGGWGTTASLNASNILLPVSTNDATNFYYTNDIDVDGTAISDSGVYNFNLVTTSASYYYVSKKIYLTTSEETDMNCCLRNISIENGTDESSNIYEAVRVSFTSGTTTKIFKATSTNIYPAISTTQVANSDPGITQGGQANSIFTFGIRGVTKDGDDVNYNVTSIIIKIWVEGQHPEAIATYAGTGFKLNMSFQTY